MGASRARCSQGSKGSEAARAGLELQEGGKLLSAGGRRSLSSWVRGEGQPPQELAGARTYFEPQMSLRARATGVSLFEDCDCCKKQDRNAGQLTEQTRDITFKGLPLCRWGRWCLDRNGGLRARQGRGSPAKQAPLCHGQGLSPSSLSPMSWASGRPSTVP